MAIRVLWANAYNGNVSGFRLYRSEVKADLYKPESKMADFATETLNYEDTTALPDVPYFYGVESLTDLGTMQSKPMVAIQYMNSAGPGSVKLQRGNYESGLLDMTSVSYMSDLWNIANGVEASALAGLSVLNRVTMGPVPGYREDLVMKMSVNGKAFFMPADFRIHKIHATAAARQTFDEGVRDVFDQGVYLEYQGYRLKMELMDADVAMEYWLRCAGGPNNGNGWVPRCVEKPIPSHANHYALVKRGNKIFRMRSTDARPYLSTLTEATLTDPFTAGGYAYPLYVLVPAD